MTPFRAHMARLDAPVGPPAAKPVHERAVARRAVAHVQPRKPVKARRLAAQAPRRPRPATVAAAPPAPEPILVPGGMTPFRPAAAAAPQAMSTPVTVTVCENPTAVAIPAEGGGVGWPPGGVLPPGGDTPVVGPPLFPPGGDLPPFSPPFVPPDDGGPPVITPLLPPTQTAAVPEPATWAMMTVGFGVIGATLRRGTRRPRRDAA